MAASERSPPKVTGRLPELDGLRGWAALSVVVFHLGWEIFGATMPVFRNPFAAALNGSLAVAVFFVLSGEALSSGFFSGRGMIQVTGLAVKRLPRLSIPVFFCILLTFAVARAGLTGNIAAAAKLVDSGDWLGKMDPAAISPVSIVRYSLIDVYAAAVPRFDRVPFLWTMNIELLGSLLVFVILSCWSRLRHVEGIVLALGGVMLLNPGTAYLADFCFGVVISSWRHRRLLSIWSGARWAGWAALLAAVVMLAASALAMNREMAPRAAPFIAPVLVVAVFMLPRVRKFLSGRLSGWLGRISFPLYLVQYPVIVSLTAAAIVVAGGRGELDELHAAVIVAGSVLACLLVAVAFMPVEALTQYVGQRIGRTLVKGPDEQVAPV